MLLVFAVSSLFISLLSPALGYLFLLSVGGEGLFNNKKAATVTYSIIISGVIIFKMMKMITFMEVGDIVCGVVMIVIIFQEILKKKNNYITAFFYSGLIQITYSVVRWFAFAPIYKERLDAVFLGYRSFIEENIANLGEQIVNLSQVTLILEMTESVKSIMFDYQVAIWGITMLLGMYVAMVFFARKLDINWEHHNIRFPYWFSYILIMTLALSVFPVTRTVGINGLLIALVFFLIQGLSIIDHITRQHFKKSRFVMIGTVVLLILNIFFAVIVSILGLLDYWLDIRKINK